MPSTKKPPQTEATRTSVNGTLTGPDASALLVNLKQEANRQTFVGLALTLISSPCLIRQTLSDQGKGTPLK
ncbi:hypothetical protein Dimus_026702, partial [Dionaea muscipula]